MGTADGHRGTDEHGTGEHGTDPDQHDPDQHDAEKRGPGQHDSGRPDSDQHRPVLTDSVLTWLAPALEPPGSVLVDATLGRAGHASALLAAHPGLAVIGVDADDTAIEASGRRLAPYQDRVTLVHAAFDEIEQILAGLGLTRIQGILFDLGVSSPQLDDPARGFAYSYDAPLDMRMDRSAALTAADVVNTYSAAQLARVLREYGEERFARRIADAVVRERARTPLTSTRRLSEIVRDSIPAPARRTGGNPAKRTFQALRIEVNGELDKLTRALPMALDALAVRGRIVVLAYHSLEDRAVKHALAERAVDTTPPGLPVTLPGSSPQFRLLTRGAQRPSEQELELNPRSASARLRAAERIRDAA
jgi:16S rRNA (cytosine1402-N4)-methyltransferase